MTSFASSTGLVELGGGEYLAQAVREWWVSSALNGGWMVAVSLRAASLATGSKRPARSISVYFLAPTLEGEVRLKATVLRQGRTAAFVSVDAFQGDSHLARSTVVFSSSLDGRSWEDLEYPGRGVELEHSPALASSLLPFGQFIWIKTPTLGYLQGEGDGVQAVTGGICRLVEPEPIDEIVVAALADGWLPAAMVKATGPSLALTLELTVEFAQDVGQLEAGSELIVRFTSPVCKDGYFSEDGEIWTERGTLLARSRQLAILGERS